MLFGALKSDQMFDCKVMQASLRNDSIAIYLVDQYFSTIKRSKEILQLAVPLK